MSREEVIDRVGECVRLARKWSDWVEFSCEDGTRSDPDYLCKVVQAAVDAGATTINIPDTVGYSFPEEMASLITYVRKNVNGIDDLVISVHCHDDLGLAVANSLAGVTAGARQVECTVNGIGERAGNAALEEIVMALKTRSATYDFSTRIVTEQIFPTSRQVATITGIMVQPNKAVVGANAFAHEAGIHQHGVLQERTTYEIMDPESIGLSKSQLILGKHSGRHAFASRVQSLGYNLTDDEIDTTFKRFKAVADSKKTVFDEDIEAIIAEEVLRTSETYKFISLTVMSGSEVVPTATVKMEIDGIEYHGAELGNGPVDATYNAILKLTGRNPELLRFSISAITGGTDALGEATIRLKEDSNIALGKGTHEDILVAAAKAMVNALNRLDYLGKAPRKTVHL